MGKLYFKYGAMGCGKTTELLQVVYNYEKNGYDESQFLNKEQVKELWLISKLYDVPVITYGLKTNFLGELFSGSKALIEKADEIKELVTICSCSKKAKFNVRIVNGSYVCDGEEILIDGIDSSYEAMCPKCYIDKVLKIKKIK